VKTRQRPPVALQARAHGPPCCGWTPAAGMRACWRCAGQGRAGWGTLTAPGEACTVHSSQPAHLVPGVSPRGPLPSTSGAPRQTAALLKGTCSAAQAARVRAATPGKGACGCGEPLRALQPLPGRPGPAWPARPSRRLPVPVLLSSAPRRTTARWRARCATGRGTRHARRGPGRARAGRAAGAQHTAVGVVGSLRESPAWQAPPDAAAAAAGSSHSCAPRMPHEFRTPLACALTLSMKIGKKKTPYDLSQSHES